MDMPENRPAFKMGQVVKVRGHVKPPQFRGRVGAVVVTDQYGEVGVSWKPSAVDPDSRQAAQAWFLPEELEPSTPSAFAAEPPEEHPRRNPSRRRA
jgi:hypothetical protein